GPGEVASLVGGGQEIEQLGRLLDGTRLLTVTGAGGSGKTRLAVRVGSRLLGSFADGVWFVDLASVQDAAVVPATIAKALGVPEDGSLPILDDGKDQQRQ